jgi:hypothetical protein
LEIIWGIFWIVAVVVHSEDGKLHQQESGLWIPIVQAGIRDLPRKGVLLLEQLWMRRFDLLCCCCRFVSHWSPPL